MKTETFSLIMVNCGAGDVCVTLMSSETLWVDKEKQNLNLHKSHTSWEKCSHVSRGLRVVLGVAHLCCAGGQCDQIVEQLFKK